MRPPTWRRCWRMRERPARGWSSALPCGGSSRDRKSTRLNSSHLVISYAVFCFKKKTSLNSSHLVISYAVFCLKKKMNVHKNYNIMYVLTLFILVNIFSSIGVFMLHVGYNCYQ